MIGAASEESRSGAPPVLPCGTFAPNHKYPSADRIIIIIITQTRK